MSRSTAALRRLLALLLAAALCAAFPAAQGEPAPAEEDAPAPFVTAFGDVDGNGAVSAGDALLVLQHSVRLITLPNEGFVQGDADGSNALNAADALLILQYSVRLTDRFPADDMAAARAAALDGLFTGGTRETVDEANPAIGADLGMTDADILRVNGLLYAYYATSAGIRVATSADGVAFTDRGLAVPLDADFCTEGGVSSPSAACRNGVFYLVYAGVEADGFSPLCLATSTDGLVFEAEGELLSPRGSSQGEQALGDPALLVDGNGWWMTYTMVDGDSRQIGLAFGSGEIYSLSRLQSRPVVFTACKGYDSGAVLSGDLLKADGRLYMAVSAADGTGEDARWSHGFLRSSDRTNWQQVGRSLVEPTAAGPGRDRPIFVTERDVVWVYYREGAGLARARLDYDAARVPAPVQPVDQTDEKTAALLNGIFTGETAEIADSTGFGASFHMHFPDFLRVGDELWAYYIGSVNGKMGTKLAVSADGGATFRDCGPILGPNVGSGEWDDAMTAFAGAWYDDGVYYLVYEGSGTNNNGAIGLATSTDGVNFTKQGKILDYTRQGIEAANIGTPDLYKEGDTWYLFYHCFDGVTCQICVATGPDLYHLCRYNNPIIPTVPGRFDSGTTGRRDILYSGGWYYMVYEVSSDQPYNTANWGHSFARSRNLLDWEPLGATLYPLNKGAMGHDGPCWLIEDGNVYVYFRLPGNSTARSKLVFREDLTD